MKTDIYEITIKPLNPSAAAEKALKEYSEQLNKACEIEQAFYFKFGSFMPDDLFQTIVEIITK
ncbi:MAG: hypothetical protein IK093_07025 [Ruminiclostridium sp.]|nr:hypothetical protein [Ruminiclostridium sp.]